MSIIIYKNDEGAEHAITGNHHYFDAMREGWKTTNVALYPKELAIELERWHDEKQVVYFLVRYK